MELRKMECPGCGANIDIKPGISTYYCEYCGTKLSLHNENYREVVFKDIARIKELELQEESRKRQEEKEQAASEKTRPRGLYPHQSADPCRTS